MKEPFIVIGEQKDTYIELSVDQFSFNRWLEHDIEYDRESHNDELRERVSGLYIKVNKMLDNLTPKARDRLVRYIKGENQEDIARDYGVHKSAISRSVKRSVILLGWQKEHLITIKMILLYGDLYLM